MKNKKIFIICIIIVLLIATTIIGVMYWKTDFLKSEETLFYKYLSKTQIINPEVSQRYKAMYQKIKDANYSSSGNVSYSITQNDVSTNVANIQEILSTKYNILCDKNLKQTYADFTLSSANQNIATLKYLKDNNIYALKMDNVVNKYLAIQNTNLKEFASKLGMEDTSKIPNSISQTSLEEVMRIDDSTMNEIKTNYMNLVKESMSKNNFNKIKNSNGTITHEISLSEKETKSLEKAILQQVKNDDTALKIIIEKMQKVGYEVNIDSMKTSIQEKIDDITNGNYSEERGFFKLAITEKKGAVTKIDMNLNINQNESTSNAQLTQNTKTYNISADLSEANKISIILNDGENAGKAIIAFGYTNNDIVTKIELIDLDENYNEKNTKLMVQYQVNNYNTDDITQNASITLNNEDSSKGQINFYNDTQIKQDINIEKITDNNAALLNNKSAEELNQLFYQIQKRIEYLYGNQMNLNFNN